MKSIIERLRFLQFSVIVLAILFAASPASAQWTVVTDIPPSDMYSVWSNADTIVAGADTAVYISTDAGTTWQSSARPLSTVQVIDAVWVRNGRLYAGTFGQGVFVSDDLGSSWQAFNQGLVGGFLDSQLDVSDFEVRGDSLYAATEGAGVYVRTLAGPGTWHHFGEEFEPNQASNVNDLALGGTRLIASAGDNGQVFYRDPGDAEWTISNLDNVGLHPGTEPYTALWNGDGWVAGTTLGIFSSTAGQEPWTRTSPGLGPLSWTAFAIQGQQIFGAFVTPNFAAIEESIDSGATWHVMETLPGAFIYHLAVSGGTLFAARLDGLWRRSIGIASVPPADGVSSLRFVLSGPQPVRDQARLRFDMPKAGIASIEVFDVLGRRVADRIQGSWSPGPHEVSMDTRRLDPGIYAARLTVEDTHEVVRLVRIR